MQQDNNNIENKLRQLDSQQLPDLSHMDEHWQKMQAMLQPPVPKSKLRINNKGKLIGGGFGAVVIVLCFLGYQKLNTNTTNQQSDLSIITTAVNDTAVKNIVVSKNFVIAEDSMVTTSNTEQILQNKNKYSVGASFKDEGLGDSPSYTGTLFNNTQPINKLDQVSLLNKLMTQFVKGPQQFFINNTRDTVITAAEGTSLYIPANSFGGSNNVEVTVTEYYKRSDIILNQLNTESNKDQLVTGGMLNITATDNGKDVKINDKTPLKLFMADTSNINMVGMQLFDGDKSNGTMNWIPRGQYFARDELITEVRVLNIIDQPFRTVDRRKGEVGHFILGDSTTVSRNELKKMLKEKYGYYKIYFRQDFRNVFHEVSTGRDFDFEYSRRIGDSVWMEKEIADRYKLQATATRQYFESRYVEYNNLLANKVVNRSKGNITKSFTGKDTLGMDSRDNSFVGTNNIQNIQPENVLQDIKDKYSVNITKLGWINCDRFYADTRRKISYQVNLGDAAMNYYTMLVFDKFNSMMTGVLEGNKVTFHNIPIGEPVKIISIGINQEGETVYSVTSTTTNDQVLTGLKFEKTSTSELKASLSKLDQ